MRYGVRPLQRLLRSRSRTGGFVPIAATAFSRAAPLQSPSYASVSAADLQFGQPVHETHPHLLKPGERMYHVVC